MVPKVTCHIMSSVDGRLLPSRWTLPYDSADSSELFKEYAAIGKSLNTDAWMFGKATTKEAFPCKFIKEDHAPECKPLVFKGKRTSQRLFITIDPEADILFTSDKFRGDDILTILGKNASPDYRSLLEERNISYIVQEDPKDLKSALTALHDEFGISSISLQGGGIIDGEMLAKGLINELSLVIYPGIDGLSSSPSIFEYIGDNNELPASGQSLQLLSAEQRNYGIVWLRYKFHQNS